MISLVLAVLSSALVSIVMRLSTNRVNHNLGMLTMNYIVCALFAGLFGGFRGAFDMRDPQVGLTLAMGAVNGVLYLAGFVLMQTNIRKNGVVLSSIFQKLGLLVTLVISVVFYRELPDLLQGAGFCMAIVAIVLMNYRKGGERAGSRGLLIAMLFSCGMADAMSKVFTEAGMPAMEGQFLFYTFAVAMGLCFIAMVINGQKIGGAEALFGILVAVPNFFASKFLLGALEALSAVIVYPVFSVGTILVVTLTGVLAFRERLTKLQWIGIGTILVALVLLNI
ncbi:MAG: DMT family transporter [Oscillospiraceae bacterium]|nr:DMT family transporter [Oscillospiraceae bacterium]